MWFDKLTTNGINKSPFVLSLSKDIKKGFARNKPPATSPAINNCDNRFRSKYKCH